MRKRTIGMEFNVQQLSLPFATGLVLPVKNLQRINAVLLFLATSLLVFYVIMMNSLSALQYKELVLQTQLKATVASHTELINNQREAGGLRALSNFAQRVGLVEQTGVEFISAQHSVAQRP